MREGTLRDDQVLSLSCNQGGFLLQMDFKTIRLERFSIECRKSLANCFGFSLLHSVIGSKFSRHFFNQSELKPKPIVALECTFSRTLRQLRVITSRFDWFTGLSPSFLIGQSNYFGFGFTTLDRNSLYHAFDAFAILYCYSHANKAHCCCCYMRQLLKIIQINSRIISPSPHQLFFYNLHTDGQFYQTKDQTSVLWLHV